MVEDFEDYADLNGGATATTIRTAADSPSTHASTMQALVDDLSDDSQQVRGNVEGDIQDATEMNLHPATDAARRLTQSGLFAVGLLNSFADTVETFDTEVETINAELHDNTYARWQAQESTPKDNSEAGSSDGDNSDLSYAEIKAEEKAKLQGRYNQAHTTLENEADRVAGLFEGSPDLADVKALVLAGYIPLQYAGIWPNLELTDAEREQAQIGTVREMSAEEQAEYVRNTEDIPAGIVGVLTPDAQEILANDVASDVKDKAVDSETVRILALLQEQAPFAHAFYSQVTPNQMTAAIEQLSSDAYPNGPIHAGASSTGADPLDQDGIDLYKNFLSAAGGTLATYSKGTDEYAPPADAGITWGNAIIDEDNSQNAGALSLLLREGGENHEFDGKFLSDVADTVYEYERDHEDDQPWGSRGSQVIDPDAKIGNLDDNVWGVRSFDAMANVLGAMKNSPDAAQMFFADGYPDGDTSKDNSRLEYLLTERTFSKDLTDTRAGDEGDGLGLALEAAAAGNREHTLIPGTDDYADEWSANFTSEVFNTIADKSGSGNGLGPDEVWHIWPDMADSLGAIGASYSSDIYDIVGGAPKVGPAHLDIDLADMDKVFGEIGRGDKTGIEVLTAGIMLEGNDRLGEAIEKWKDDHPGQPIDLESVAGGSLGAALSGIGGTNGEVLGHIINKAITVDEHDQSLAETRAAYVSKAIDIAGGFIPGAGSVLGETANELLKSGYDVAKGQGLDLLKQAVGTAPDATSGDYVRDSRSTVGDALESSMLNQLIKSGVIPVGNGPHQVPPSLVTEGPNGTQVLNPELFDADGPDTIGEEGDYTDAEKRAMQEDLNTWFHDYASAYGQSMTDDAQDGLDRELNR